MLSRRGASLAAGALVAIVILAAGAAPLVGLGADHLDAGALVSPRDRGDADLNDIYIFEGNDPGNTVLAMTTNPLVGVLSPETFGDDILYEFKIDRNGDARADVVYRVRFGEPNDEGRQWVTVRRARGIFARLPFNLGRRVAAGWTDEVLDVRGGGSIFAGKRSDPFFFDLDAFLASVEGLAQNPLTNAGIGGRAFGDADANDPFATFDTLAIVLEVPDAHVGDSVGVWANTRIRHRWRWVQVDRMGLPAINTVFNASAFGGDKDGYNRTHPRRDERLYADLFSDRLVAFTTLLGMPYSAEEADAVIDLLLPDILPYDTGTSADFGALNGRALADDVISFELGVVTNGVITDGGVAPHADYQANFPYLGEPHG